MLQQQPNSIADKHMRAEMFVAVKEELKQVCQMKRPQNLVF